MVLNYTQIISVDIHWFTWHLLYLHIRTTTQCYTW